MSDPLLLPLRLSPRLDPKPWGGARLAEFGFSLPAGVPIGEAVITAPEATITSGELAGRTLGEVVATDPLRAIGASGLAATGGRAAYPVLLKLIDAHADLSIQVHPDDTAAASTGQLGKTETYHVLTSDDGAMIALGLRPEVTAEQFAAACRASEPTTALLRWLPARAGESILIPAGTIHALGAGCLVFEAQQPSEVTYRLDDWGRLGTDGQPRALHVEPGLAVYAPASRPEPTAPLPLATGDPGATRELLTACRYFAVERLQLAPGALLLRAAGGPQSVTLLHGSALIRTAGGDLTLTAGETAVVPAAAGPAMFIGDDARGLRAWVPDLTTEIVAPALAAGHSRERIARLSGGLADLWPLLDLPAAAGPAPVMR